jgi:hypothetical protein
VSCPRCGGNVTRDEHPMYGYCVGQCWTSVFLGVLSVGWDGRALVPQEMQRQAPQGPLSRRAAQVLRFISRHPGLSAGDIRDGTGIESAQDSLSLLVTRGLVQRGPALRGARYWPTEGAAAELRQAGAVL